MKKSVIFSMAIIALVLIGISFVPTLFLEHGDRLVWQMSNWSWICASLLIPIIGVLLTIYYSKGKHILWKILGCLGCMAWVIACLLNLYIAMLNHDEKYDKIYYRYEKGESFL